MKAIYCLSRLPEWLEVAQNLENELGWTPFYWVTVPGNHEMVGARFPKVVRHLSGDANRGLPAPGYERLARYPLDEPLLRALSEHESIAYDLMDRMDLDGSFRHIERRRAFRRLMAYWLSLIEYERPGRVVFNAPPHSVAEYTLYAACCARNVATVIFLPTAVDGILLVERRVFDLPRTLTTAYRNNLDRGMSDLSEEGRAHFDLLRRTYEDAEPWYTRVTRARDERKEFKKRRILEDQESDKRGSRGSRADEKSRVPMSRVYKRAGMPLEAPLMTRGEYNRYLEQVYPIKARLGDVYRSLAQSPPLDAPFVYMPLHYQPERTTCPDGGRYNDQSLSIAILSANMPAGAWLYVKEHPSQFSYQGNGEQARTPEFYQDLASLPNVKIVDMEMPSFDLIDNSRGVATITGVAGWEALARGKPALVFGHAWYLPCNGVFAIESSDDCRAALEAVFSGMTPSERDVLAFIAALEEVGVRGYINPSAAQGVEISPEENVTELTRGILDLERERARDDEKKVR